MMMSNTFAYKHHKMFHIIQIEQMRKLNAQEKI